MNPGSDHPEVQGSSIAPENPATFPQDGFRRVLLGQAADPLYPPHPGPPEVPEEELAQAALADTFHPRRRRKWGFSPLWRVIGLVSAALIVLGWVLWRKS